MSPDETVTLIWPCRGSHAKKAPMAHYRCRHHRSRGGGTADAAVGPGGSCQRPSAPTRGPNGTQPPGFPAAEGMVGGAGWVPQGVCMRQRQYRLVPASQHLGRGSEHEAPSSGSLLLAGGHRHLSPSGNIGGAPLIARRREGCTAVFTTSAT